eukprot:6887227-Alexandrium_andersonii.AAC.1
MLMRFSEVGAYVRQQLGPQAMKHPISSHATMQRLQTASSAQLGQMLEDCPEMVSIRPLAGRASCSSSPQLELPLQDDFICLRWSAIVADPPWHRAEGHPFMHCRLA